MAAVRTGTRISIRVLCLALGCMLGPQTLAAQVVIQPGDQIVALPAGTSGERPGLFVDCPLCRSDHSPDRLRATAIRDLPGNSRVTLFMSREFQLSPAIADSEVEGLIRISFSLRGVLGAAGAQSRSLYNISAVLADLETGRSIAASPVTSSLRQGASISVTPPNSPVGYPVPDPQSDLVDTTFTQLLKANLRRGHRYAVIVDFEVRAQVENSLLDPVGLTAFARSNFFQSGGLTWTSCLVSVAPDGFERLSHELAAHHLSSTNQLARHDGDIKTELSLVKKELDEIKTQLRHLEGLLLTPDGRRPGFPKK